MDREQLNFNLQYAPLEELTLLCQEIEKETTVTQIQKPTAQTLLVPVNDPINHGSFISGEVLVTSAIVQVNSVSGWAMVMDDIPELATNIAILDGAYAAGVWLDEIVRLAQKGKAECEKQDRECNAMVNSTRVSFDLL